jgi:molecular chaperone GrpE
MVDETNKPGDSPVPQPAASGPGEAGSAAPDAASLAAKVETLEGQIADLTDRLLRAHAEMDNMRKRAEREKEETAKYAITKFARDVVAAGDNFQRAIDAVPPEAAELDPALKSFLEGVTMTEREFLNALERHGVKRIDPAGGLFNPHQHQAVMENENPSVPAGTILQVLQSGYMLEDRVLRPAMVIVAKGGQKPAKSGEPAPSSEASAPDQGGQAPGGNSM